MGDEELVRRVRQGDGNSADELVARHYAAVLRYCAWHCRDAATAEDLTQETFLHVFRGFSRYAERGRFRAYLYTVARRLCIDEARRRTADPFLEEPAVCCPELEQLERADEVRRLLARLPAPQREAVLLRYGQELTIKEIALVTGVPARTAQSRVRLALAAMRKEE